jgi:hypothetical protein
MPDNWGDDFGGDWDLDGGELFLDDELDPQDDWEAEDEWDDEAAVGTVGDQQNDVYAFGDHHLDGGASRDLSLRNDGTRYDEPAPAGGGGEDQPASHIDDAGRSQWMSWDAWDVGTAFALGGWVLDQHAERVGRQLRAALTEAGTSTAGAPRSAPHPPPPSGVRYEAGAGTLTGGNPLDPRRLYGELLAATAHGRGLMLQAEGKTTTGGRVVLVVSSVPGSVGPGLWVVAEQHPGGFAASRLTPVFQADPSGAVAVFATDLAVEAADAVVWACQRVGIEPTDLIVARRAI